MKIFSFFKKNFILLPVLIIIFLTLYPALSLPLPDSSHEDLSIVKGEEHLGKNASFLHPSPIYFFRLYGTQFSSLAIAYRLFDFNSKPYFILNITLRILSAVFLYYFISKWFKSKLAGAISSLFFGVNTAGIQATTRVSLFQIYVAIIVFTVFLNKWFKFHNEPNKKNLIYSIVFFLLTIFAHPIRLVGTVLLTFVGEIYRFLVNLKDKSGYRLRIYHFLAFIFVLLLLIFVIGTLASTPELSYKRVFPQILLLSLFTGYPPAITSLWFFISNLIISPASLNYGYITIPFLQDVCLILPFIGSLFLVSSLFQKKFLFAFLFIPVIVFSPLVAYSSPNLEGWQPGSILITQFGGAFFLIANLILIKEWNKNKDLAQIGLLGSTIIFSNLLIPWLISPQLSVNDQSAFNFIHRYYTVPSIGMGMLFGSLFSLCIYKIKSNLNISPSNEGKILKSFLLIRVFFSNFIYIIIPLTIFFIIFTQVITTREHIIREQPGINAEKTDLIWSELEPTISRLLAKEETTVIYIDLNENLNQDFLKGIFNRRIPIHLGQLIDPPKVDFVFNQSDINKILQEKKDELLKTNSFYAFKFDGKNLTDIKEKILSSVNK